jgi:hypothetical protein
MRRKLYDRTMPTGKELQEAVDTLYSSSVASEDPEDRRILAASVVAQALVSMSERLDAIEDRLEAIRQEVARPL